MLYISIGIIGATVMPHNLYLHSSIVQTRKYEEDEQGKREAIKFVTIDSTVALIFAFFINAAILIVSAAVFIRRGTLKLLKYKRHTNYSLPSWRSSSKYPICFSLVSIGTKFYFDWGHLLDKL